MPDAIPPGPFDQGLFLTHFNKGRDLFDRQQFEEAERELEEAYLLRPRDQRVLNLLGLVYFKQDKLEKAEEVYRKLAVESPDAHTLHYNLGLIYFKLNRLEDAESSFLKALEMSKGNPKINFYLGSIYERLLRHQDAIYQYRQAGANLMVRRIEDRMAGGAPGKPAKEERREDDTAEFPALELEQSIRRHSDQALARADQALAIGKVLQPVSPGIMAAAALHAATPGPASGVSENTARFRLPEGDTEPAIRTALSSAAPAAPAPQAASGWGPAWTDPVVRPPSAEIFRFLENNLMEIDFSGKVYLKQGTIYSYSGNLTFWVKEKRPEGSPALVIVTGNGRIVLLDKDREITFMRVMDEAVFVEPGHLLACEEGLSPRYVPLGGDGSRIEFVALEGRGMVALSTARKPLALGVTPALPVSVPASSVILWSGELQPRLVEDPRLYEIMLPAGAPTGSLLRLEGTGRVLVEQSAG
jgi:Flp pilus assembly protein TadD/uncharacterized protein (AIM24 family)